MAGPDIVNLIADLIARLGFPIAVAAFLLWERRTTLKELTTALRDLNATLQLLISLGTFDNPPRG